MPNVHMEGRLRLCVDIDVVLEDVSTTDFFQHMTKREQLELIARALEKQRVRAHLVEDAEDLTITFMEEVHP